MKAIQMEFSTVESYNITGVWKLVQELGTEIFTPFLTKGLTT